MNRQRLSLAGVVLFGLVLATYLVLGLGGMGQARAEGRAPASAASLADDEYLQPAPHPILSEVNVRRAVAYCTDKDALVAAAYPELNATEREELITDTFMLEDSWAYVTPATVYAYDPDAGRALLEAAGWELPAGEEIRMKDGQQLALALRTTDAALRLAFMPVFEAQMRACGMRVIRSHEPNLSWLPWRDFELTEFAWGVTADELLDSSLYGCDQIPGPENGWSGSNFMGWCNEEASLEINQASDTSLSEAERITHYQNFIDIFAEEMPSLILFWRYGDAEYDYFEHIDFNLETYLQTVEVTPEADALLEYKHYLWTEGTVRVPAGTVTEPVTIGYYPQVDSLNPPPEGLVGLGFDSFRLSAYEQGLLAEDFVFWGPITVSVNYPPVIGMQCQGCVDETTVALYVWNGDAWEKASETCPEMIFHEALDLPTNHYEVNICTHLSEYMMMAEPVYWNFLPVAAR